MKKSLITLLFGFCLLTIGFAQESAEKQAAASVSSLVSVLPDAGGVDEEVDFPAFEATEWVLSNGARIILKPTNLKKDEVVMKGFSWGGSSVVTDPKEAVTARYLNDLLRISGIGTLSENDLSQLFAEKGVKVTPYISSITDEISGVAPAGEVETMLQLIYLYFTESRTDKETFKTFSEQLKNQLNADKTNPQTVLANHTNVDFFGDNPTKNPIAAGDVKKINYEKGIALAKDRFSDPDNFTFVFVGDFNLAAIQPLIELYIGGIEKSNRKERWADDKAYMSIKDERYDHAFSERMDRDQIYMLYFGKMLFSAKDDLYMNAFTRLLELSYAESLKDLKKDIQNLKIRGELTKYPHELVYLHFNLEATPQMRDLAIDQIKSGVERMAASGPAASDLKKVKKQLQKEHQDALKTNQYYADAINNYVVLDYDKMADFDTILEEMTEESMKEFVNGVTRRTAIKEVILNSK